MSNFLCLIRQLPTPIFSRPPPAAHKSRFRRRGGPYPSQWQAPWWGAILVAVCRCYPLVTCGRVSATAPWTSQICETLGSPIREEARKNRYQEHPLVRAYVPGTSVRVVSGFATYARGVYHPSQIVLQLGGHWRPAAIARTRRLYGLPRSRVNLRPQLIRDA